MMPITVTTYDLTTGELGPVLTNATLDLALMGKPAGHGYLMGTFSNQTHKVDIENAVIIEKVAPLSQRQDELWERAKRRRAKAELNGCVTPKGVMDTDEVSQRKINGYVTMAMIAQQSDAPFVAYWTMANDAVIEHNAEEMIAAGVAVGDHVAHCHSVSSLLRASIYSCTTEEELDAIDVEGAAWPSL